jgi:hypothetical protein
LWHISPSFTASTRGSVGNADKGRGDELEAHPRKVNAEARGERVAECWHPSPLDNSHVKGSDV